MSETKKDTEDSPALLDIRISDPGSLLMTITPKLTTCRWCGKEFEIVGECWICSHCSAVQGMILWISQPAGPGLEDRGVALWHNPDNSLYIEFVEPDKKTSRYILSPTKLLELGMLQLFDHNPKGKRA
jgi:hypothetical protein